MKVLVAKRPKSPADAVWSAMGGEIVVTPFVCQDSGCMCDHVHQGIVSHGYSSEAEVRDVDTAVDALVRACQSHLEFSQWAAVVDHPAELAVLADELIADMSDVAEGFAVGTALRMTFDHAASTWGYAEVP